MYVIKMEDDKSLTTTIRSTIYQGEKNADVLTFIIPQTYDGYDMAECTMILRYIMPDGTGRSEEIVMYPLPYNEDYYQFKLSISTHITDQIGSIELWLTAISFEDSVTLKTGTATIVVKKSKNILDYFPQEDLDQLSQMSAQISLLDKNKADNLTYDAEDKYLQLTSNGVPIGDVIDMNDVVDELVDDEVIHFGEDEPENPDGTDDVIYFDDVIPDVPEVPEVPENPDDAIQGDSASAYSDNVIYF